MGSIQFPHGTEEGYSWRKRALASKSLSRGIGVERASTLVSIVIGLIEMLVGFLTSSVALVSDGVSSFADASVSTLVWLGLKVARRNRDGKFHFGYLRVETFSSLASALVMIAIAFLVLLESYVSLVQRQLVKGAELASLVALVAAGPSFYLGHVKRRIARSTGSAAVSLDSYNSILGGISSLIAFLGVFLSGIGIHWGDAVAGMLIAFILLIVAYSAFKEGSLALMDACMCPDVLETVESVARGVEEVEGIHDIRLRRAGPYITGEVHVEVDGNMTIRRADEIAAKIERQLQKSIEDLHMITVKVESKRSEGDSTESTTEQTEAQRF